MPYWKKIYGGWVYKNDDGTVIGFGDPADGLEGETQPATQSAATPAQPEYPERLIPVLMAIKARPKPSP